MRGLRCGECGEAQNDCKDAMDCHSSKRVHQEEVSRVAEDEVPVIPPFAQKDAPRVGHLAVSRVAEDEVTAIPPFAQKNALRVGHPAVSRVAEDEVTA